MKELFKQTIISLVLIAGVILFCCIFGPLSETPGAMITINTFYGPVSLIHYGSMHFKTFQMIAQPIVLLLFIGFIVYDYRKLKNAR